MGANFSELLKVAVTSVERPKPLPPGTYDGVITGYETGEAQNEKKTPYVRVLIKLSTPQADVDQAGLQQYGGMEALQKAQPVRNDFWLTQESLYRLREFFENVLGVDVQGKNFDELLPQVSGRQVKVFMKQEPSKKAGSDAIYTVVDKLLKAA